MPADVVRDNNLFAAEDRKLRANKQWKRLLDLYEARASILEEPGKERMYYKAGEVATDELGDADLAEQYFMRAFKVRRSFMPAIGALRVLHTNNKNNAGLLQVLNYELEVTTDPRRRAQLFTEVAGLLKPKDPDKALDALLQAVDAYPKSRLPLEQLEALARKRKRWEVLVQAYEKLAGAAPSKQAAVYFFLSGTVLDEQVKDKDGAGAAFSAALGAKPQDGRILTAIERHFEKQQDWDGLSKAIWQHLELAKDKKERIRLLKRQAKLYEVELKEPVRAQRLLEKVLSENAKDAQAIKTLFKISEGIKDPRGMANALEHEAELPTLKPADKADRLERAAEQRDRAKDGKRAYEDIKRSLELRPRHPRALKLLERITRRLGNWEEHVAVLDEERGLLDARRSDQEMKATLTILRRIAEISEEKLKDEAKARQALNDLVDLDPQDGKAWDRLIELAERAEDWRELAEVFQRRVDQQTDEVERRRTWRRLAEVRRDKLQDLTGAAEAFESLLEQDPADAGALTELSQVYADAEDHPQHADALRRLAKLKTDRPERAEVLRRLAEVELRDLEQPKQAQATVEEALSLDGEDEGGLAGWKLMAEAAEALGDDDLLRQALAGVKRFEQDADALRWVRIQLAKLEDRAGNHTSALATLQEVLAESPADTDALPVAVRLLKQAGQLEEAVQRLEAAALVLDDQPVEANQVHKDLARILEEDVEDPARARAAWEAALRALPGDEEAFEKVVELSRAQGELSGLFELLEQVSPEVRTIELRHQMWREQAAIAVEALEAPAKAANLYERIVSDAPDDAQALAELRKLHRQLEAWGPLVDLLETVAQSEELPEATAHGLDAPGCWREAAQVAEEHLHDLPRAANALEVLVREITDAKDPAWETLVNLYAQLEQHTHRVRVLEKVAGLAKKDKPLRAKRLAEAAAVYEEQLRDYAGAAEALVDALEATPGVLELLIALSRVRESSGDYDAAAKVLAEAAEAAEAQGGDKPEVASQLLVRRGSLMDRLGDARGAEEAFDRAIRLHPGNREAHDALVRLLEDKGAYERLESALSAFAREAEGEDKAHLLVKRAEVLQRLEQLDDALAVLAEAEQARPKLAATAQARVRALRLGKRPQELADAIKARREADPLELTTKELLNLMREEAELRGFALDDLPTAHTILLEALKRRSKDVGTLQALLRVERQLNLSVELADHLEAAALLETDKRKRADLLLEAGRILKTRGEDAQRAKGLLARALKADPERIEAVRWLGTIAREEGDAKSEVLWTTEEAKLDQNPRRRAVLHARLGQLLRKTDPPQARASYERALAEDPQYIPALRGLAPLLRKESDWINLDAVLERLASLEPDRRTKVDRYATLGDLRLQALEDATAARAAFDQALQLEPNNLRALRGRTATFDPQAEAAEQVESLRQQMRATPRAEERVELGKQIARVQQDVLDDQLGAVATLEEVLRLRPLDRGVWKQIRQVHVDEQRWGPLARTYEEEARQHPDVRVQEELFRASAQLYEHHLGDQEKAAELYGEVLKRGDPQVLAVRVLPAMLLDLGKEAEYEAVLRRVPEIVPRTGLAGKCLYELGQRALARGEEAAAVRELEAALVENPDAIDVLDLLAKLHEDAGRSRELVLVLKKKRTVLLGGDEELVNSMELDVRGFRDPGLVGLCLNIAKHLEEELKDVDGAITELQLADSIAEAQEFEGRRTVLDWLARLCRQRQRFAELAEVLGHLADQTSRPEKGAAFLIERAQVERHRLQDARSAIVSYQGAFSRHPSAESLDPLLELLEQEQMWEDLAQGLDDQSRLTEDPEARAASLARMAEVLDERLNRPEDAIAAWERVLEAVPGHQGAFDALEAICTRTKNARAHARALEREVGYLNTLTDDPHSAERLVDKALKAAKLHLALKAPARASEVLETARAAGPLDRRVFDQLDQIYQEIDEAELLHTLLQERARIVPDRGEQVVLRERLAVLATALGRPEEARDHWEKVIEVDAGYGPAVSALKTWYTSQESWEELARVQRGEVDAFTQRAAAGDEEAASALPDLFLAHGHTLESRLQQRAEAVSAYAEAATRAKGDPRPLRGLERIHANDEAWEELGKVRIALRDMEESPGERAKLSIGVAEAWEHLGRRPDAITALYEALDEVPDDAQVMASLRRDLLAEERYAEAVEVLAREANVAPEKRTEYEQRMQRAALLRDQLDNADEAIAELERARGLAPLESDPLLALAPLYEAKQDIPHLVEVLEARANLEEEDATAADLYAQAGALNVERDPAAASASYEKALRRDPLRSEPLEALTGLYEKQQRWDDLSRTLHRRGDLARALQESGVRWLREAARIEEHRLSAKGMAAATLEELLREDPSDEPALAELARLRGELGEHAAHEQVVGRRAELAKGGVRHKLLLERAAILDEKLSRPAAAASSVRVAYEELPESSSKERRRLAGELIRLQEAAGDQVGLLDAAERAARDPKDDGDQVRLLRLVGRICAGPVYQPERAIEVYRTLYERDAADAEAGPALEQLYQREARWQELADHLDGEAKRLWGVDGKRDVALRAKYRQAELLRGPLRRPADAERCYREILKGDVDQDEARDGLEAVFRAEQKDAELAALLAERAGRAPNAGVQAQFLTEEAAVHERLGAVPTALERLEKALGRAREQGVSANLRARILRTLIRLYRRERRLEELSRALAAFASEPGLEDDERAAVYFELGMVEARDLKRPDEAVRAFEQALGLDPRNVPAARGLASIYRLRKQPDRLVVVYEREAAAKVDKARLVWLKCQIGELRQQLGDLPASQSAYREALDLDGRSLVALHGLAGVARAREEFHTLAPVLESLAKLSPSAVDRLEARRELAGLYEEALGDTKQAVENYQQVLADAPDDRAALRGLARGLRTLKDEPRLVDCLEQELKLSQLDQERRLLALEAGRLRESLAKQAKDPETRAGQLERALDLARLASELDPDDLDAVGFYARVAEELGRWQELADATVQMARSVDDTKRCGWMLRRAAKVRSLRLGDSKGAAAAFLEAVEVDPSDAEAWKALEPLAEELKDDALLLRVLQSLLRLAPKDAARATVALKLGAHLAKLGRLPEAIDALILARSQGKGPQRAQALEGLEKTYRATQRWQELAEVIDARAGDLRLKNALELMLERAKILEERLGREDLAIEVQVKLRTKFPDELRVLRELERLLSKVGRWTDLVEFYETEAARRGRAGYDSLVLLARVARDHLDDPDLAANALQRAVTLNPSGLDALENLKELYAATERWSELLDTLRLEIGVLKDPQVKEKRLRTAGQLAEDKLGDLTTAERFYAEALQLMPRDRNLVVALGRVQEGRGEWQGLADSLRRELTLVQDPGEQKMLQMRLGRVLSEKLKKPYEALDAYRRVLELEPRSTDALSATHDLLRDQHEWDELSTVIGKQLAVQPNGPQALPLRLELARVQAEKLERPDPAIQAAEQSLAQDPSCREAAQLMVDVLERWNQGGRNDAALVQALSKLGNLSEGGTRAEVYLQLGELLLGLKQEEPALKALREAFRADPLNVEAGDRLIELLERRGAHEELETTLSAGARASSGFRAGELLTRLAHLLETHKGDVQTAEKRYREALKLAPSHVPALEGLARLLVGRGAATQGGKKPLAEELTQIYAQLAKLAEDPQTKAAAHVHAGDVLRDALDLYSPAQVQYEAALKASPQAFDALASLAEMIYAAGDLDAALPYFERVAGSPGLGQDPERAAELLFARGECLEELGRLEQAAGSYREVLKHRPNHLSALTELGRLLLDSESWAAARPVYEELIKRTKPPRVKAELMLVLARIHGEQGQVDQALDLYRKALEQLPKRYDGHLAMAKLVQKRDPKEARRHYEYVLAGDSAADKGQARLELADLFEVTFQDPEKAAGHLQQALELPGEHRAQAAKRLAEIHGRGERWTQAVHNLRKAIEFEQHPERQGELHANMARVLRDRLNDPTLARKCFERALELNPHDKKTLESLLRLLEASGDLDAQIRVLGLTADEAQRSGVGDEVTLRVKRAQLLAKRKKLPEALREYERVLAVDPNHAGARTELSQLYLKLGKREGLERVHRELLRADPFNVSSYQALSKGWKQAGEQDAYGQAAQVLAALRAARGEEKRKAEAQTVNMPRTKVQVKDDDFAKVLVAPPLGGPLLELVRHAGNLILEWVPGDLKQHGIGWRSKAHGIEGEAFPEHYLVKRICDLLGVTQLDVYWEGMRPEPILARGKSGPALILNQEVFAGLSEAEKAFVIGRAIAPCKLNLQLFTLPNPDDVRKLVLAALRGFDGSRSFPGQDEKTSRGVTKSVSRAGDKLHTSLARVQRRLWELHGQLDFAQLQAAVRLTAARTGLLVAGGMFPAANAIANTNMALKGRLPHTAAGVVKMFREIPELVDLAPFAVSDGYLTLRSSSLRTEL